MEPQQYIQGILKRLYSIQKEITELAAPLTVEQLNFKPNPKSWSIAEVADHIITANATYFSGIAGLISSNPGSKATGSYKHNCMARMMVYFLKPDGMKLPAPPLFEPESSHYDQHLLQRLEQNFREIETFIDDAKEMNLVKLKMPSPALSLLHFNLGGVFDILVTHAERHYLQMKRVLASEGFPR